MRYDEYRCVECGAVGSLEAHGASPRTKLMCSQCGADFPVCEGRPVLIAADNELFQRDAYLRAIRVGVPAGRRIPFPQPSVNLSQQRLLGRLGELLATLHSSRVLVAGAGKQRLDITAQLATGGLCGVDVICVDVDSQADVDCYCDVHQLPFANGYFDAVITTAVLEHVIYPERAAAEIARVVRVGGFIYSELPFMQQVHEGAYDFTRYTLSGHRRLLNQFRELDSGAVAGPGTTLVWAIENFAAAWFRSAKLARLARVFARLAIFWLKYFDYLFDGKPAALDGASCTYFLGERVEERVRDSAIVARYEGAREVRHV